MVTWAGDGRESAQLTSSGRASSAPGTAAVYLFIALKICYAEPSTTLFAVWQLSFIAAPLAEEE